MKNICLLLAFFSGTFLKSQDITGDWYGALKVMGIEIRLTLHVNKTDNGYESTMDSPDQGASGIPVTTTTFNHPDFAFELPAAKIEYRGKLANNKIEGTFTQAGQEFPLNLSRDKIEKKALNRPQEPKEPFAYYTEEVMFKNRKAQVDLYGTLTLPKKDGKFPVVIMITGSGPQNRNEEILGHKPFLVIADHLAKNGIGSLRFDDRGTGKSTGDHSKATSADFANDVKEAVDYLMTRLEVDKKKIGLMGHSEGGLIAPLVAAGSENIRFIVLLAGPGVRGGEILLAQQELIGRVSGASEEELAEQKKLNAGIYEIIYKTGNAEEAKKKLKTHLPNAYKKIQKTDMPEGMTEEAFTEQIISTYTTPWMYYFIKYDPAPTLQKLKCAVLAVNGSKDLQVPSKQNLDAIKINLSKGRNNKSETIEFPGLNHLFQECKTGSPDEYGEIEQTFSPAALEEITKWIVAQTK
ncbi:MAG TPA: alpha/beta fold hydrolase [Flavobacteriales bacterium]|nr:alpha/beta fold hydrolase [Flavobacteriales bacterium]